MSGTDAAATLTLEISTTEAQKNLAALNAQYEKLHLNAATPLPNVGTGGISAETVQQIRNLEAQVGSLQAAYASLKAGGEEAATALRTSMAAANSSMSHTLNVPAEAIAALNAQMKAAGEGALAALQRGMTNSSWSSDFNMLAGAEKNTLASLKRVKAEVVKAQAHMAEFGESAAHLKFGSFAFDPAVLAALETQLTAVREIYSKSSIELVRIQEQEAEAVRASQIRSSVERIRVEEQLAEQERAAIIASRERSTVELVRIQEQQAEAVRASQIRSSVERIRVEEQLAEQERAQIIRDGETRLALERKYILASEEMRLKAAIDARKLMDAGYAGNLATQFAPQTLATAGASSVAALEAQLKALSAATAQSGTHQAHWNSLANEGNAAARGLAGTLGGLWLTYGSLVPLVAAAALASSLKHVFTAGKDLEYEFTYIQAITNGTVISLNDFSNAIQGSMATPVEAARGLRVLAQAGLEVNEAMIALPSVLKLATVGEVDFAGAALAATAIMHTFGMEVKDISHIGDSLATAARLSATSVKEMMAAMKQASSVSNVFGVSLHETEAALATLANRGIEGSAAGTAIRNMVKELSSPATDKAAYALQQYGIQIYNADGSAKKFTENLQQLSDVTSVMTKQTKAKFLEDMFNERGAKAANILLSDLDKMKTILKEIEMSSSGLGFMTEAQIRISTSTKGMIKALGASISETFGTVFLEVKPQIDSLVSSLASVVRSSEFKQALTGMAEAVANFTLFLREHAGAIAAVITAYAGFKVLGTIGATVLGLAGHLTTFTAALAPLAVGTATWASAGTALATVLSGPVAIGLGLAAVAAATYAIKQAGLDDTQKLVVQSAKELTEAQGRLNQSLSDGLSALTKSNALQAERINLLRAGKTAADAAASAMDNLGYASAKANATKVKAMLGDAQRRLADPEFAGQDINFNPSKQFEAAFDTVQALTRESKLANAQLEASASDSIRAGMQGRQKELQDVQEKAHAEVEIQNKKFEAITKRASLAATELSEGKFYGSPESQAARKKTLQADIARGVAAQQFKPLDGRDAESDKTKVELARRDAFLSENSLAYARKEKPVGGAKSAKVHDYTGDLEKSTVASLVQQEQENIKVLELLHKNHLISEDQYQANLAGIYKEWSPKIEAEYDASIKRLAALTDAAQGDKKKQYMKKLEDMTTARRKFMFDEEYRGADSLLAEQGQIKKSGEEINKIIAEQSAKAQQAIEDLEASRLKLDMTPAQAAGYDAARDVNKSMSKPIADLQAREQSLINAGYSDESEALKAVRAEIEKTIEARKRLAESASDVAIKEAEFAREYSTGWKTAYKEWADDATNAAKAAKDSFSVMATSMESALNTFLTTGKINFADFTKSVILGIAKIEARAALAQATEGMGGFKGIVGSILSLLGMGKAGPQGYQVPGSGVGAPVYGGDLVGSANGNVFSGSPSLHAYANTVQDSPRTFAYANIHSFAKGGVFAEAGPEAVMPLARDSNGRLGIRSSGAISTPVGISITVNHSTGDTTQTMSGDTKGSWSSMAQRIRALVVDEVNTQKRPGGILYS